jgi:hypothetical protein
LIFAGDDEIKKAVNEELVDRMADAAEGFMTQATPIEAHTLAKNICT